nr:putative wall-associated receptor kinase-like 16 [Quercus suber]POF01848.1 wall-associated receptor kinase 2 [Quercus suber]
MALHRLLLHQQLLLLLIIFAVRVASQSNSNCVRKCGNVEIPYPFGTSVPNCSLDESFLISCDNISGTPKPFLSHGYIEILNISLNDGELLVSTPLTRYCSNNRSQQSIWSKFPISDRKNKFIAVGCGIIAYVRDSSGIYASACISSCVRSNSSVNNSRPCSGCCETTVPPGVVEFTVDTMFNFGNSCVFSFVVEKKAFNFSSSDLQNLRSRSTVPVVLDWAIANKTCEDARNSTDYACRAEKSECHNSTNGLGYLCKCSSGFEGNAYDFDHGCKDINECERSNPCNNQKCNNTNGGYECICGKGYEPVHEENGKGDRTVPTGCRQRIPGNQPIKTSIIALCISVSLLILLLGGSWICWGLKRRKHLKLKEKFFQQNGGLLLRQQVSNHESSMTTKIFTAKELKKATNNYDESTVLGQGGYGTVYKGVLSDNKVVAIKKSKIGDQSQIEQFINEVIVLTQINHRNVVKLFGCCLETEVPLLVYEFITNGTLCDHIHDKGRSSLLSWEKRLKIAIETAEALAYLHSATSMPIIHRDIKTANILLDDNYTAKVADFGASRLVPLDQTQLTTLVQGTLGYLDPEYLQTSNLTEKSDVYSFGVVMAELLTGKKALSFDRPEIDRNLATSFVSAIKEDRLLQIVEVHIVNDGNIEQLKEVANLAKRCLRLRGDDRPSMKEVAAELERLKKREKKPSEDTDVYANKTEYLLSATSKSFDIDVGTGGSTSTTAEYNSMNDQLLQLVDNGR